MTKVIYNVMTRQLFVDDTINISPIQKEIIAYLSKLLFNARGDEHLADYINSKFHNLDLDLHIIGIDACYIAFAYANQRDTEIIKENTDEGVYMKIIFYGDPLLFAFLKFIEEYFPDEKEKWLYRKIKGYLTNSEEQRRQVFQDYIDNLKDTIWKKESVSETKELVWGDYYYKNKKED